MEDAERRSFDTESTVIKPTPGGVRATPVLRVDAQPEPPRADPSSGRDTPIRSELAAGDFARSGNPPMVAAALPLLSLIGRLRTLSNPPDLEALRLRCIAEMNAFEAAILGIAVTQERARAAHYALCATIDDVVLNSSWGGYSIWASQGMTSTFHTDVTGGERFFDLLAHLHKDPGSNRDVLLLMYYGLSLGFEGAMRKHPQGHLEIGRIREGLYRTLRGDLERELSPEWRGVDARLKPIGSTLFLWGITGLVILALTGLFFALQTAVTQRSDATFAAFLNAPPNGEPSLHREMPRPKPVARAPSGLADGLRRVLRKEIGDGAIDVDPNGNGVTVRIRNAGLFESGSAVVAPAFTALFERIGEAIKLDDVTVQVVGHTDNVPIHNFRFPSNYELSVARAEAVVAILGKSIGTNAIRSEGRGEAQPVRPNDRPENVAYNNAVEGRAQNRRTELVILRNDPGKTAPGGQPPAAIEPVPGPAPETGSTSGPARPDDAGGNP